MNVKNVLPINNYEEIKNLIEYASTVELDDLQMQVLSNFLNLEVYQQNLIMLKSRGLSLRDIGKLFDVSYQWVRTHINDVYKKINE